MVEVGPVTEYCKDLLADDPLAARLSLAALVQRLLKDDGYTTIIVGGTAVDTFVSGALGSSSSYPAGWEESMDIDTVVLKDLSGAPTEKALQVLERHGFVATAIRTGARLPGLEIPIDFVGDGLPDDYSPAHVYDIHMEPWQRLDIGPVHVASPEDILFDYTESGWDTRHPQDWARALAVAAVMGDDLDLNYLFSKAHWRRDGEFVAPLEQVLRGEPMQLERDRPRRR